MKKTRPISPHAIKGAFVWISEPPVTFREKLAYICDRDDEFLLIRTLDEHGAWSDLRWFDAFTHNVVGTPPVDFEADNRDIVAKLPTEPRPVRPASVPLPEKSPRRKSGQHDMFAT